MPKPEMGGTLLPKGILTDEQQERLKEMTMKKKFRETGAKPMLHQGRTRYSCGVVEKACSAKSKILIADEQGKQFLCDPRIVHKRLTEMYAETHPRAGEGKYIDNRAFNGDRKHIRGAHYVNPYLDNPGSVYAAIVELFQRDVGIARLRELSGRIEQTFVDGEHIVWEGRRNHDRCILASPWRTADELWEMARKWFPEVIKKLSKTHSPRPNAKKFQDARSKFLGDIEVLRRASVVINPVTNESEYAGGATPCAKPLEQCGMAIDKRYLTYDVDPKTGEELGQYYYRMVWGRPEPAPLSLTGKDGWAYQPSTSRYAYLDERIRQKCKLA